MGVVKPYFSFPHGVLIETKMGQTMRDELVQRSQRLGPCDRPTKTVDAARMVSKSLLHQADDFLRDLIRRKTGRGGKYTWPALSKAASVVCIKIPLVTNRLFAIHQDASFLAKFAVEKFQPDLLSVRGMSCKISHRAEKMHVITNLQLQLMFCSHCSQALQYAPFTRRGHDEFVRLLLNQGFFKL